MENHLHIPDFFCYTKNIKLKGDSNNMKFIRTFKTLMISVCSAALLLTGCSSAQNTTATTTNNGTSAEEAFDELTRDIFTDYAGSDSLTLNYTLKDPSAYGIELEEATWGDVPLTEEDFAEEKAQTQAWLDRLNKISGLTGERAVTYDVVKYYLEADLESYDYIYQTSNLAPLLGFQSQLPTTMAEYHFDDVDDVEDYLTLLNSLGNYIESILAFENQKADAGYGMCKSALEAAIEDCQSFIESPETNLLIEVFPEKLEGLNLSDDEKNAYIKKNQEAVINSVIPAYQSIIDGLTAQIDTAPEKGNISSYENGQDYYKYLLKSSVGTDKTPEELIELTEGKLNSAIFFLALTMNANPDIFDEVDNAGYSLTDPTEIIDHFKSTFTAEQMPEAPEVDYTLKNVHESLSERLSPAMYFIPRIDDIANNQIYLNLRDSVGNELMPTMAHEGYPGHMYQITYYYNTNPDPIRTVYECSGYVEGWASYVESLSYDYCGFEEDVADFYRTFNAEMALNLYCRADLGIHYEGWDVAQTGEFIRQYLTFDDATIQELYDNILYNPTNYMIYGIGMDEILEMRDTMEDHLDKDFDIKDFHKQLLDLGPAPFPILRKYMPDADIIPESAEEKAA